MLHFSQNLLAAETAMDKISDSGVIGLHLKDEKQPLSDDLGLKDFGGHDIDMSFPESNVIYISQEIASIAGGSLKDRCVNRRYRKKEATNFLRDVGKRMIKRYVHCERLDSTRAEKERLERMLKAIEKQPTDFFKLMRLDFIYDDFSEWGGVTEFEGCDVRLIKKAFAILGEQCYEMYKSIKNREEIKFFVRKMVDALHNYKNEPNSQNAKKIRILREKLKESLGILYSIMNLSSKRERKQKEKLEGLAKTWIDEVKKYVDGTEKNKDKMKSMELEIYNYIQELKPELEKYSYYQGDQKGYDNLYIDLLNIMFLRIVVENFKSDLDRNKTNEPEKIRFFLEKFEDGFSASAYDFITRSEDKYYHGICQPFIDIELEELGADVDDSDLSESGYESDGSMDSYYSKFRHNK